MRCVSCGLVSLFLIAGHALAAEPGAASPPKAGDAPPPEYYVEPSATPDGVAPGVPPATAASAPPPRSAAPDSGPPGPPPAPPNDPGTSGQIYEPQPPGFEPPGAPVFEPPPPPEPHHVAPRTSLWLGARVGLFVPFGSAWSRGTPDPSGNGNVNFKGVPWSDYVSSGPMFELDAGARLSRNYNVFAIWERAQLGSGSGDVTGGIGKSNGGDTDFWGVGIRATSDPDRVGFVTELAVGWRRARATYDDGSEVQFTQAPFEARLGLGAEFRLNQYVSLSPMATLGVGSFGEIERKTGSTIQNQQDQDDQADGHAWATLTFGGNFDLLGSQH